MAPLSTMSRRSIADSPSDSSRSTARSPHQAQKNPITTRRVHVASPPKRAASSYSCGLGAAAVRRRGGSLPDLHVLLKGEFFL